MLTPSPSAAETFWSTTIAGHKARMAQTRETWAKHVRAYRSEHFQSPSDSREGGSDDVSVEANYLFAFTDSLIASICPPNPQVDVVPRRRALKKAGQYRTLLVNDFMIRQNVAAKLWKLAARAVIYPRAFVKLAWNTKKRQPVLRVLGPQWVFFDQEAEDWEDLRYIIEVTVLTRGEVERRVKKKRSGFYSAEAMKYIKYASYPDWLRSDGELDRSEDQTEQDAARQVYEWATVYEVYDLVGEKFYHFAEGVREALYVGELPYAHLKNPFNVLVFNDNLEDLGGLSDAKLVYKTLERLNTMSSLRSWHTRTTIPVPIIHEGLLDDPDEFKDALENISGPGQYVGIKLPQNVSVNDVMGSTPTPQLPVDWDKCMAELTGLVEFVLGLPAYARGDLGQSDVATELALANEATRTRNSRRQKALYLLLAWMARGVIGLYTAYLRPEDKIPMRLMDEGGDDVELTRDSLALPAAGADGEAPLEDVFGWDYDALPFNASEENSVVKLKTLEVFLPVLMNNGAVDQVALARYLAELLKMPDIIAEAPPQGAPAPGAPAAPGMGSLPSVTAPVGGEGSPLNTSMQPGGIASALAGTGSEGDLAREQGTALA